MSEQECKVPNFCRADYDRYVSKNSMTKFRLNISHLKCLNTLVLHSVFVYTSHSARNNVLSTRIIL